MAGIDHRRFCGKTSGLKLPPERGRKAGFLSGVTLVARVVGNNSPRPEKSEAGFCISVPSISILPAEALFNRESPLVASGPYRAFEGC